MNRETAGNTPEAGGGGTLYVVATPIGNLEDITARALRILREASLIAAEDTRHTLKLLTHFGIKNRLVSSHAFNERPRSAEILAELEAGKDVAVVSDAGTPVASDPGGQLVAAAVEGGFRVVPVPGPSAITAALSSSNLSSQRFAFEGFLPRSGEKRRARLRKVAGSDSPVVIFEAANRVNETLTDIYEVCGDRRVSAHREMTKRFEETIFVSLAAVAGKLVALPEKGEYTLVVEGAPEIEAGDDADGASAARIDEALAILFKRGMSARDASAAVSELLGVSKRAAYDAAKNKGRDEV